MKVPYIVSENTRQAYETAPVMRISLGESDRRCVPEDFADDTNPASLSFLATQALSTAFETINPLDQILQKDVDILMDLYPDTIPLKYSVPFIKDEQYWKRTLASKYPKRFELGIKYYKGKYLSVCLQEYLENASADVFIVEDAQELAVLVSPYIYELGLKQLQIIRQPPPNFRYPNIIEDTCPWSVAKIYDHIPLGPVLEKLYNLQEISLVFAKLNLEDSYTSRYFEFSHDDCESLCSGIENLMHLKVFRINRSNLDCSKAKLILQKLVTKPSIEELDFNHCIIGDYGMKALGGFISVHENIKVVRIANNRFKEEGVQGIAYALQMKPVAPIELIDFSLNKMSVECATMFAAAFVRCKEKPQTLIVNSCGFHGLSAVKIVGLLCLNRGLTRFDMAANNLAGDAETTLIEALEKNRRVLKIDLRMTNISEETQTKVNELLERNQKLVGTEVEPSDEIPPLYLNEPEYLIWEYNPNNPDYIPGRYPERVAVV